MKVLLTGAAGFSGSHIAEEILSDGISTVVSLDCLTYAGNLKRLAHLDRNRIKNICHDFTRPLSEQTLREIGEVDYIIHCGAETHVPRSFENPEPFIQSNVIGTLNILEAARKLQPKRFLYVSTDEVLGEAQGTSFDESFPYNPSSPYAATKASGELLVNSYQRSFGIPVIITRTSNMFGERQHCEKFIPKALKLVLSGKPVTVHVAPDSTIGCRQWLHARKQANALLFLLQHPDTVGEVYHIAGDFVSNLGIVQNIGAILDVSAEVIPLNIYNQYPSHDLNYDISDMKLRRLGWKDRYSFLETFKQTILWTKKNQEWLEE